MSDVARKFDIGNLNCFEQRDKFDKFLTWTLSTYV